MAEPNLDSYTVSACRESSLGGSGPVVVLVHDKCDQILAEDLLAVSTGYLVQLIHAHEVWCDG